MEFRSNPPQIRFSVSPTIENVEPRDQFTYTRNTGGSAPLLGSDNLPVPDFDLPLHVDLGSPNLTSAGTSTNGRQVILTFNEPILDEDQGKPAASAFTVTVTVGAGALSQTPTRVQIVAREVRLTLPTQILPDQTNLKVSYTMPPSSACCRLSDPHENDVATFSNQDVTNLVVDTAGPMLEKTEVAGSIVTLTFDEALDSDSEPATSAFTVSVNGNERLLQSVENDGKATRVTLVTPVVSSDLVAVSYTPPGEDNNPLQDLHRNPAPEISSEPADNRTPLSLVSATVDRAELTLAMSINGQNLLNTNSTPAPGAFTVRVDGTEASLASVNPVRVSDSTVTLTLDEEVGAGASVEVNYVQPTSGNILKDLRGVAVATFDFTAVENITDYEPPNLTGAGIAGQVLTLTFKRGSR